MSHKTLFALALLGALSLLAQQGTAQETGPIQNGFHRQPTQNDRDVTSDQAREIDRLYNELMSSGESGRTHHHGITRMR